jgi:dTDP-4-dehydrorhamnose reductase
MNKILVTGSSGQLGSEIKLLANIISLDTKWIFSDRSELDFLNYNKFNSYLDFIKPDIIINCAAFTAVDKAESDYELADRVNHIAVGVLANWVFSNKKKIIHISTDYVFDGESSIPLTEESEAKPINVYGKTKLAGELLCIKEDPNSIIIRTSWVYSFFGSNFVKTMLKLMMEREQLKIINDQIGSPTYAYDLASAIITIINSNEWRPGIYNYSNEGEISWYKFAQDIKDLSEIKCELIPVSSKEYHTVAKRPAFSLLDKSKIKENYNIYIPDYKESLYKCINRLNKTI